VNNSAESSEDLFQLSWRHTPVTIRVHGKKYPLETRLHFIHYDGRMLTNILYLTPSDHSQEGWIVGFDAVGNKVCPFTSKREVVLALECLIDSVRFTQIFSKDIDVSVCQELVHAINSSSLEESQKALLQIRGMLKLNVLAKESALGNESYAQSPEGSLSLQLEDTSLKLTLGSIDLTDSLVAFLRVGGRPGEDSLILTMNIQATSDWLLADYNDDIRLRIDVGRGWESIFAGLVKEAQLRDTHDKVCLTCRDYTLPLEESVLRMASRLSNPRLKEAMYFIIRGSGWQAEKVNIEGLDASGVEYFFLIMTPISNIDAAESFGIGDVTLMRLEEDVKVDLQSSNPPLDSGWETQIWARVYVSAPHFYEAQVSGLAKVDTALDLLACTKSDSKPFVFSHKGHVPIGWHRSHRFARVVREPWVYIRDVRTKEYILANLDTLTDSNTLEVITPLRYRLDEGTDEIQILLQRPWENLTQRQQSLVYALRWLRRAWDEGDGTDKLIYLWNAIELIVGQVHMVKLFSSKDLKIIKELARSIITDNDPQKVLKHGRLDDVFNMLNDPSLLAKLRYLVNKESINLPKEEWDTIRESRKKRNDLIHGRLHAGFSENEARKLAFIVNKIITNLLVKS